MSEEIDALIRSHRGPVIVQLTEAYLDSDQRMDWLFEEAGKWWADARVVRLALSLHREWARKHRVHGAPCVLVFQSGRLHVRLRGRYDSARLRETLERAGLLGPSPSGSRDR